MRYRLIFAIIIVIIYVMSFICISLLPSVELKNNDAMLLIGDKLCPIFQENDEGPIPDFEYREVYIDEHKLSKIKRSVEQFFTAPLNMKIPTLYDTMTKTTKASYVARIPKDVNFSAYIIDGTIHYNIN